MLTSRISELSFGGRCHHVGAPPDLLVVGSPRRRPNIECASAAAAATSSAGSRATWPALDRRPDARSRPPVPPHHRLRQARRSDRAPARSDQTPAPTERPLRSPPHSPHTWTAVAKNPRRPGHLHRDAESLSCSRRPAGARPQLPFPAPIRDCRSTASTEEQGCARGRCADLQIARSATRRPRRAQSRCCWNRSRR